MEQAFHWLLKSEEAGFEDATKVLNQVRLTCEKKDSTYDDSNAVNFWKTEPGKPQAKSMTALETLNAFTEKMGMAVTWKISKEDTAWCYLPNDKIPELEKYNIFPAKLRKTADKKYILLIEKISKQDLDKLGVSLRVGK